MDDHDNNIIDLPDVNSLGLTNEQMQKITDACTDAIIAMTNAINTFCDAVAEAINSIDWDRIAQMAQEIKDAEDQTDEGTDISGNDTIEPDN